MEWNIHFTNDGNVHTLVFLKIFKPSIFQFPVTGQRIPTINYSRGCGGMDTYALRKQPLNQLESFRLSNRGGGKTGDTIPFFDIQMDGRGMIGAVGWPGTWAISLSRPTEKAISVTAGMQNTHLVLHAGEEIRAPQVLLLPWSGDDIDAHNVLRAHNLKIPHAAVRRKAIVLPVSHLGWGGMKTSTSLRLLDQITKERIGFETFWMDAGWYGADREVEEFQVFGREDWFLHAGNWRVNRVAHPNGLKPYQ